MKLLLSIVFFLLRAGSALLFIWAGAAKVADPGRFLLEIQSFHLLPYWLEYVVAHALPCLEIICGLALFTLGYSTAASLVLMLMTGAFVVFLATARLLGIDTSCGCFGKWNFINDFRTHMYFNAALLIALAITCIRCMRLHKLIDKPE